jgi:FKBP-type peptidyl-prolyl cis-trans isomerase
MTREQRPFHFRALHLQCFEWENLVMRTLILAALALLIGSLTLQADSALAFPDGNAQSQAPGTTPKPASAAPQAPAGSIASPSPFKDEKAKISYALGMNLGMGFHQESVDIDPQLVLQGLQDGLSGGKTQMTPEEMAAVLRQLQTELRARQEERRKILPETNRKEGEAFLAANKLKQGVVTLPSGLQYKVLTEGTGPKPGPEDTVVCNYRGTLMNGTEFDSSARHGGPSTFRVNGVIAGWTEALQLMHVGSKWQLFVPPELAYGERGMGDAIGPNSVLIFEVELVSIRGKW